MGPRVGPVGGRRRGEGLKRSGTAQYCSATGLVLLLKTIALPCCGVKICLSISTQTTTESLKNAGRGKEAGAPATGQTPGFLGGGAQTWLAMLGQTPLTRRICGFDWWSEGHLGRTSGLHLLRAFNR